MSCDNEDKMSRRSPLEQDDNPKGTCIKDEEEILRDSPNNPGPDQSSSPITVEEVDVLLGSSRSAESSNEFAKVLSSDISAGKSLVLPNDHDQDEDTTDVFIDSHNESVVDKIRVNVSIGNVNRNKSPVRLPRSNSCSAQFSLTPVRVYRGSCGDYNEVFVLEKKNYPACSSSDKTLTSKKNTSFLKKKKSVFKSVVDCMNINQSVNQTFQKNRVSSIEVVDQSEIFNSKRNCSQDSECSELSLEFGSENSNSAIGGMGLANLFSLPIKSACTQITEDEPSTSETNLFKNDEESVYPEMPRSSSHSTSSDKNSSKSNVSLVDSFTEPSQHFNMSAIHKDVKMMKLKSEELPSFHSQGSPTSQLNSAATSTPVKAGKYIIAPHLSRSTPSLPVTPIRSRKNIEICLEYPLEKLVRQDKLNDVQQQESSLCPNISFVNTDCSNSYLLAPPNFSNLASQSESYSSDDEHFFLDGDIVKKIDFTDEGQKVSATDVPYLQKMWSRKLNQTELKICTIACQMAWRLHEKVYKEIYERLSHMETDDEHYRIDKTSRYKSIYLEKIEKLWHFIVPRLEERYWNLRSLKVINKNLLIYGNRRLNAKQWEFVNFHNCVFDIPCVFDYGLFAYDTDNPVFHRDNIQKFLAPNYNPEVSCEEDN